VAFDDYKVLNNVDIIIVNFVMKENSELYACFADNKVFCLLQALTLH
jgi:hypothetical protein